ncbi:hypothetical protein [Flavitalea sp.]|nr:hypothetical protein [Flavitalea sp.]
MAPEERIFNVTSFYQDFEPTIKEIDCLNEQYVRECLPWYRKYTQIKQEWVAALAQLNKLHDAGIKPELQRFYSIDDDLEAYKNQKPHFDQIANRIEVQISSLLFKVRQMFKDIQQDKSNGFLSAKKHWEYIRMIKNIIKNGSGMSCYQDGSILE